MNVAKNLEQLPAALSADLAAEVIAYAAREDSATSESEDMGNDSTFAPVDGSIPRSTLIASGVEIGIPEDRMIEALARVSRRVNVDSQKVSRRLELGLAADASQAQLVDEIAIRALVDNALERLDVIIERIVEQGKTEVEIGTVTLASRPYDYERATWSRLKRFFRPFAGKNTRADLCSSPALKELIEKFAELGVGVKIEEMYRVELVGPFNFAISLTDSPGVQRKRVGSVDYGYY